MTAYRSTVPPEVRSGLEGVVAFATTIAEPDREGGALRYRGVDIEDLVGTVPYEQVWGLLVDGTLPARPRRRPSRTRSPSARATRASTCRRRSRCSRREWGFRPLIDISDEQARDDLARASVMALSFVAQSARGDGPPAGPAARDRPRRVDRRALPVRWRGEADPRHVKAIDAYWISAAEHGMNASTFTARVIASTGADVAAALSAPSARSAGRCTAARRRACSRCSTRSSASGDAERVVRATLDRGERLMGFGHRIYRAEDPRARVLRRTARELGSARFEVAEALERAALAELRARRPDRVLATNVEFWSAVLLDLGGGAARALHGHVHVRPRRPGGRRTSSSRSARVA